MKIQKQNSYNPNMKSLYFTKAQPLFTKHLSYENPQGMKTTKSGIRYIKDNSAKLTPIMKEALTENSLIKNLSKNFETFVLYAGERYSEFSEQFSSSVTIYIRKEEDVNGNGQYITKTADDKYTPEGARLKLLAKLNNTDYEMLLANKKKNQQ